MVIPLAAATITWLALDATRGTDCYGDVSAAAKAFANQAIVVTSFAAIAQMAAIAWISTSREPGGRRPSRPTAIALGVAAVYLTACLIEPFAFAVLVIAGVFVIALGALPGIFLVLGTIAFGDCGLPRPGALALAWAGLLIALPANVVIALLHAYGPLSC